MAKKAGWQGKLLRSALALTGATTTDASGATWIECKNISNVKPSTSFSKGDTTVRKSGGIATEMSVQTVVSIEFDLPLDITDADYIALETVAIARTEIALAFMSGDITVTGERGWVGNWTLEKIDRDESKDKEMRISFVAVPSSFPQYFVK
jgi:hypothetical protein